METVEEAKNQLEKSPKRIKFEEIVEEGGEDRISGLPDYLILEILSRLPFTEDAIQTGILSKRWKHLWTSIHTLIFDYNDSNRSVSNFVSFVDKTLAQCRQLKLKKFEVYISNNVQLKVQVNSWIHYALNCNVEELKVELCRNMFEVGFVLDQSIFTASCFTHLSLQGCQFNPSGAITWKNLRTLCVKGRKLDKDLIENISSGCPVLETLVLKFCYGYKRLDITSKSLKKLVLFGYLYPKYLCSDDASDAGIIEINAPHILSLTIKDGLWLRKLLLVNVSSLVEAYLDFCKFGSEKTTTEEILKGLILNLRHVKVLKIGSSCFKALSSLQAEGFLFHQMSSVLHD